MQENDFLIDATDDLVIDQGDFVIKESVLQEVGIILRLNSGALRSDPILAPNLIQLVNRADSDLELQERIRLFLNRDNKNYEDIKKLIFIKKNP